MVEAVARSLVPYRPDADIGDRLRPPALVPVKPGDNTPLDPYGLLLLAEELSDPQKSLIEQFVANHGPTEVEKNVRHRLASFDQSRGPLKTKYLVKWGARRAFDRLSFHWRLSQVDDDSTFVAGGSLSGRFFGPIYRAIGLKAFVDAAVISNVNATPTLTAIYKHEVDPETDDPYTIPNLAELKGFIDRFRGQTLQLPDETAGFKYLKVAQLTVSPEASITLVIPAKVPNPYHLEGVNIERMPLTTDQIREIASRSVAYLTPAA